MRLKKLHAERGFAMIVSLPKNEGDLAAQAFEGGADAVKVHVNVEHRASGTRFGTWTEERDRIREVLVKSRGPVGLMPGAETTATWKELSEAMAGGIDFLDVYDHHMPAWMISAPITRMVAIGEHWSVEDIKVLGELQIDFLEASVQPPAEYGKPLTVKDLETYRRIVLASPVPVFVPTQKKIEPEEIPTLRAIGVGGIIVGAISLGKSTDSFTQRVARFRRAC